jgi:hypothetical protein
MSESFIYQPGSVKVNCRRYTLKDSYELHNCQSLKDSNSISRVKNNIIKSCLDLKEDVSFFDLDYILLHLRLLYGSETAKIMVCSPDDEQTWIKLDVNLSKVLGHQDKLRTLIPNEIEIGKDEIVNLKYPLVDFSGDSSETNKTSDGKDIFMSCINFIKIKNKKIIFKEYSQEEKEKTFESFTKNPNIFDKIKLFLDNLPIFEYPLEFKNSNTGIQNKVSSKNVIEFINRIYD